LIGQSKSKKKKQLKRFKKTQIILKISWKSYRKQTNKNNFKSLYKIK
jgi:hypothetical protein